MPSTIEYTIQPRSGWQPLHFGELWTFRHVLYVLVWRDIKLRYRQTVLGGLWAVLQPLLAMLVLTFVFGRVAHVASDHIPYALFAYVGLLPWTFFANAVSLSSGSLIGNQNLVSKIYFPRLYIPLGAIGALLLDLVVGVGLSFVLKIYYGNGIHLSLLTLPIFIAGTVVASAGVGVMLAALNVKYRDIKYVVPFIVQMGMFVTPVIYPIETAPAWSRPLLALNPMAGMVAGFRYALLGADMNWGMMSISWATSLALLTGALFMFRRMEVEFGDVI